jgi:hypothetical protein
MNADGSGIKLLSVKAKKPKTKARRRAILHFGFGWQRMAAVATRQRRDLGAEERRDKETKVHSNQLD